MPKVSTRRCATSRTVDQTHSKSPYQRHPKPPYSYVGLISQAILTSSEGQLTLAEINGRLRAWFPFFRSASYLGWMDSIRHNLSNNACFSKVPKRPDRPFSKGCKGNFWTVDVSKVKSVFVELQHTGVSRAGHFAPYLHHHLGLPSIWALSDMTPGERAKVALKVNQEVLTYTVEHQPKVKTSKVKQGATPKVKGRGGKSILGNVTGRVVNAQEAKVDNVKDKDGRKDQAIELGRGENTEVALEAAPPPAAPYSPPPPSTVLHAALNLYELAHGRPHPAYVVFGSKPYSRLCTEPLSLTIPDDDHDELPGPPLLQALWPGTRTGKYKQPTAATPDLPHLWAALDAAPPALDAAPPTLDAAPPAPSSPNVLHSFADIALARATGYTLANFF